MPGLICVPCGMQQIQQTDRQSERKGERVRERGREKGARTATHTIEAEVSLFPLLIRTFVLCILWLNTTPANRRRMVSERGGGGERGGGRVYMW